MTVGDQSDMSVPNNHGVANIDPKVATSPSAPEKLAHLRKNIETYSQAYSDGDSDARLKLLETARSLVQAMETPQETMLRYCWAQVRHNKQGLGLGNKNANFAVLCVSPQCLLESRPVSISASSSY